MELTYQSNKAGILRGHIELETEDMINRDSIEVTATTVDFFSFITNLEGMQVQDINFGTMYFGDKVSKKFFLVNNSP